jgi:uncharacterized low-complexity protein
MSEKKVIKPIALAVGAALAGTFAISGTVNADSVDSPFAMSSLTVGYMLGEGEGSCGGDKKDMKEGEGSCGDKKDMKEGEGSCGDKKDMKEGEGSCGDKKDMKEGEGSCGEGSCGGDKAKVEKDAEGSCGEEHKDDNEGSCGGSI